MQPFFRLHSKVTATILLIFSLIVTAGQFIGDPIDCIVSGGDGNVPSGIMDTYCWIHSTFTLPKLILEDHEGTHSMGSVDLRAAKLLAIKVGDLKKSLPPDPATLKPVEFTRGLIILKV